MVRTAVAQDRKQIMDSLNYLIFTASTVQWGSFSISVQLKGLEPLYRMKADTHLVLSYQTAFLQTVFLSYIYKQQSFLLSAILLRN